MFILTLFAASQQSLWYIGDTNTKSGGLGPFSNAVYWGMSNLNENLTGLISKIVGVLTVFGGIWFIIQFLIGAFKWITSGGDKTNVEAAKEHLTHAVISLAILVSTYIIVGLVGAIFGLDILNPQKIIPTLGP